MHPSRPPRKTSHQQSSAVAVFSIVAANVALAFGPMFVRMADVGPVSSGFWRMALAAPVLFALMPAWGGAAPYAGARRLALPLAIGGICFAGDLASWHLGIVRTTLANSTLFGNSATLIYPIYGFIAARAWPTRGQGAALLLALVGGALLLGRSAELSSRHLTGDLLCLLAGALYAVYFITMARVRATMAPLPALALSTLTSAVPLLALALAMGEQVWPQVWLPLILLTAMSQLFGQGLMTRALGRLSPLVIGIALLIQPVVAAALGWAVYGETLALPDMLGAVLVAAALVLVRGGDKPSVAPPPEGVMTAPGDAR